MKKLIIFIVLFWGVILAFYSQDLTLLKPQDGESLTQTNIRFEWKWKGNQPQGLIGYKFSLYEGNNYQLLQYNTTRNNFYEVQDLKKGKEYHWKVEAILSRSTGSETWGEVRKGIRNLNFRPSPSLKVKPYYTVSGGERFTVLKDEKKWVKVKLKKNGDIGWLYKKYVKIQKGNSYVSPIYTFYIGDNNIKRDFEIKKVYIVSSEKGEDPTYYSKVVPYKVPVYLRLVVAVSKNGSISYYSGDVSGKDKVPFPSVVQLPKGRVPLRKWSVQWGKPKIEWKKILAREKHANFPSYSQMHPDYERKHGSYPWFTNVVPNGDNEGQWRSADFKAMGWRCERMEYKEIPYHEPTFMERVKKFFKKLFKKNKKESAQWVVKAICPEKGGTFRYKAVFSLYGKSWETPGRFSAQGTLIDDDYAAGIKETVHRISYLGKTGNKLIDGIMAFNGIPWLYGSNRILGKHQTEAFIGFDCADLVMGAYKLNVNKRFKIRYGANFLAKSIAVSKGYPYLNFLEKGAEFIGPGNATYYAYENTILDDNMKPYIIKIGEGKGEIKPGDLIFFDWNRDGQMDHTTVFYKDGKKAKGILSPDDYILMAGHKGVTVKRIKEELLPVPVRFYLRTFKDLK